MENYSHGFRSLEWFPFRGPDLSVIKRKAIHSIVLRDVINAFYRATSLHFSSPTPFTHLHDPSLLNRSQPFLRDQRLMV